MTYGPRAFPDPVLSIFQSAAEEYERRRHNGDTYRTKSIAPPTMVSEAVAVCERQIRGAPTHSLGPKSIIRTAAEFGFEYLKALVEGDTGRAEAIKATAITSGCDPNWLTTIIEYSKYFGPGGMRASAKYRPPSTIDAKAYIIPIRPNARIGVVGDWGTGTPTAIQTMRHLRQLQPDLVIHLGDIYYSGTAEECRINFSEIINRELERNFTKTPVYTLSGNHDMYSGGVGYYDLIDTLNEGGAKQLASYFCLRSEDNAWQILGMDTGYHDVWPLNQDEEVTFIDPDEEQWHIDRVTEFPGRTILFSHHQLFSAYAKMGPPDSNGRWSPYNPRLMATFKKLGPDRIAAWYWGHEHSLGIYKPYAGLERGRCLGHGAIPVVPVEHPYETIPADALPELVAGHPTQPTGMYYANGFALLTLDPRSRSATAKYFSEHNGKGYQVAEESLTQTLVTWTDVPAGWTTVQGNKQAFVVGIDRYMHIAPLTKAGDDALAIRDKLSELGFGVEGGIDFGHAQLSSRFDAFVKQIKGGATVVLYYSGHGVQIDGQSCLIPADATLASLASLAQRVHLQDLTSRVMQAGAARCLVFLDACRDNPFAQAPGVLAPMPIGGHVVAGGLSPLEVTEVGEVFVAFAAEPGKRAYEGAAASDQPHSLFTQALLRHMGTEGLNLEGFMRRVGADVKSLTDNTQRPWSQTNLTEDFFFLPASWAAVGWLAGLGAILGLPAGLLSFNSKAQFDPPFGTGFFFAAVVAYGVWRWGGRSRWAAAFAFAMTALFFTIGNLILHKIGVLTERSHFAGLNGFWSNTLVLRDVIATILAGPFPVFGAFIAGYLTTPALRRLRVIVYPLFAGAGVAVIVVIAFILQWTFGGPGSEKSDFAIAWFGSVVWHCLLGAAFGYALSEYIPKYSPPAHPQGVPPSVTTNSPP